MTYSHMLSILDDDLIEIDDDGPSAPNVWIQISGPNSLMSPETISLSYDKARELRDKLIALGI